MASDVTTAPIAEFWDLNPHVSEDQHFWMAHPLCRAAINRRVSGSVDVWPMDYLYERAGSPRFDRLLSLGCGMGHVERAIRHLNIATTVDAVDGSAVSIEIATRKANQEGLTGIAYRVADLNDLPLPRRTYGAVVFHQSLHHVKEVEKLLLSVVRTLTTPAFVFLEEWVGPSRDRWSPRHLNRLNGLFQKVPLPWRRWPDLRPPIEEHDPTEAIRSSAIMPALRRLFSCVVDRPYGGQLVSVLLPQIRKEAMTEQELNGLLSEWLELESEEISRTPDASFYNAILAVPARGLGAIGGRISNGWAGFVQR